MGRSTDRPGARVQSHDGPTVCGSRRVDAVPHAGSAIGAGGSRGLAGDAAPAASRQRRRGAAGSGARARSQGQPADDPAGGVAASARAGSRGAGDGALRDAAGPPASGGLRRAADAGRWRERPGVSVRGDAGLLATSLCAGVPARTPVGLAGRDRRRVPPFWRRDGRGAGRQRQGAGDPPRRGGRAR